MSQRTTLYKLNLITTIIGLLICVLVLIWFIWIQFCTKYLNKCCIVSNSSADRNDTTLNNRDRSRCNSYSQSTKSTNRRIIHLHVATNSSSISCQSSSNQKTVTAESAAPPIVDYNNCKSDTNQRGDTLTVPSIKPIIKKRDSLLKFKESARKLSKIFGHGALSIDHQQIDDKWILVLLFIIFIFYTISISLHFISIYFAHHLNISLYTYYTSYLFHIFSRFATFWLFAYLLYFVVYAKNQSVIRLNMFNMNHNNDQYVVCGNSKILSVSFCVIFMIGCFASVIQHSHYGFIVNYALYAVCDCVYLLLFSITSHNIHHAAYNQFKERYLNHAATSASIVYARNVFHVGIKSVIIMFMIGATHLMLMCAMIASLACYITKYDDYEIIMESVVNVAYVCTVTINCVSVALLFKYSEFAYHLLCKCDGIIVNAFDN